MAIVYTEGASGQYGKIRARLYYSFTSTETNVTLTVQSFAETYWNAGYGMIAEFTVECPWGTELTSGSGTGVSNVTGDSYGQVAYATQRTITIPRSSTSKNLYIWVRARGTVVNGMGAYSGNTGWQLLKTETIAPYASSSSFTTVSSLEAGWHIPITINRGNSNYTHTINISFGSKSVTETSLTTSANILIPMDWLSEIPNANSGPATITCTTYNGSVQVGSPTTKTVSIVAGNSSSPTIGERILTKINNGVPVSWNKYVQNVSEVCVRAPVAEGSYGASIKNIILKGAGYSISGDGSEYIEMVAALKTAGEIIFTTTVTDSRGKLTSVTDSIFVEEYSIPSISNVLVQRCNSNGTINNSGVYARLISNFLYSAVGGDNSINSSIQYRLSGSSGTWTTIVGPSVPGEAKIFGDMFSVDKAYDIRFIITDTIGKTAIADDYISISAPILDFLPGGLGMAVGKVAEAVGLDIDWITTFRKNIKLGAYGLLEVFIDKIKLSYESSKISLDENTIKTEADHVIISSRNSLKIDVSNKEEELDNTNWENLWVASSGGNSINIVYKRKYGYVTVTGASYNYTAIPSGSWKAITTLPVGFRPTQTIYGPGSRMSTTDGKSIDFRVNPNGIIEGISPAEAKTYWAFSIMFPVGE